MSEAAISEEVSISTSPIEGVRQGLLEKLRHPPNEHDEKVIASLLKKYQAGVSDLDEKFPNDSKVWAIAKLDLFDIAANGRLQGFSLPDHSPGRSHYLDFVKHRSALMEIYLKDPYLAHGIVKNSIIGAHGSSSASLLGVLEHGLKPHTYLENIGIPVASGERFVGAINWNREYVSCVQWNDRETATGYSNQGPPVAEENLTRRILELGEFLKEIKPRRDTPFFQGVSMAIKHLGDTRIFLQKKAKSRNEAIMDQLIRENFPVIYLVSGENLTEDRFRVPESDIHTEFGIKGGVDAESIRIILVPRSQIKRVHRLGLDRDRDIQIFPIESYME